MPSTSSYSNNSDATPAYRGYRLQTLYILWRILTSDCDAGQVFQPEGKEDLAVYDSGDNLSEVIQVKAYSNNLTLSYLEPSSPDSFLYRINKLLQDTPNINPYIVSFGEIGRELTDACKTDGTDRKKVVEKLCKYRQISQKDAISLMAKIKLFSVKEKSLKDDVFASLKASLMGVDANSAFDLLNFWLDICAEQKIKLAQQDVIDKIERVGIFLAERSSHHKEWFTSIIPIQERQINQNEIDKLSEQFYRGVAARYEHILANVDVNRFSWLKEIDNKFKQNNIVIIHGSSGQGKTTLAYRYLHEYFPSQWRFLIRLIENREHALSIARALEGHAQALGIPLAIYIDVSPKDSSWTELIKQLSNLPNIRILVTVREEDYRRASVDNTQFQFSEIELTFNISEAQQIYQSLVNLKLPSAILDFEDAWNRFGNEGMLLEFVYLITQGESLRQRLSQQVKRLEDECRLGQLNAKELELLRLVSVASAFEARLKLRPLIEHLSLSVPRRTLELFEKEYLLRRSDDSSLLQGLHPIRSEILTELLTDSVFCPWSETASKSLPFMFEADVESFLLYSFSRYKEERQTLLDALSTYEPKQWCGIAGVIKALIWLGVDEYVDKNLSLIKDLFADIGKGFLVILDFDIANLDTKIGSMSEILLNKNLLPREKESEIKANIARQTDKNKVFERSKFWISNRKFNPLVPGNDTDWSAMAETVFWDNHLSLNSLSESSLQKINFEEIIYDLPIDILANLIFSLYQSHQQIFTTWFEANRNKIISRFRQDTQTIAVEDNGETLRLHFILGLDRSDSNLVNNQPKVRSKESLFHKEAMWRVDLLRKLIPDRGAYGCQGYGHKLWTNQSLDDLDETSKPGVSTKYLPHVWLSSLNSTFLGLADRKFRPNTWQEYTDQILDLRVTVLEMLKQFESNLDIYFRKKKEYRQFCKLVDSNEWKSCANQLCKSVLLPSCAVDEWGFITEGRDNSNESKQSESQSKHHNSKPFSSRSLAVERYADFLSVFNEYTRTLLNFFNQAGRIIAVNSNLGRKAKTELDKKSIFKKVKELKIGYDPRVSVINLIDSSKNLHLFQREFRILLSNFVRDDYLINLEREEKEIINRVLVLWYFFCFHPEKNVQNAYSKFQPQIDKKIRQYKQALENTIKANYSDINIKVIERGFLWKDKKALFLIFDVNSPEEIYLFYKDIIEKIKDIFHSKEETGIEQNIFEMIDWSEIILLPLLKGKSLNCLAWRLDLLTLLYKENSEELGWWNHVQQPIPSDVLEQLNIPLWNNHYLTLGHNFLALINQKIMFMLHMLNIQQIEEDLVLDRQGQNQIEEYYRDIFVLFTQDLSKTQEVFKDIAYKLEASDNNDLKNSFLTVSRISIEIIKYILSVTNGDAIFDNRKDIYEFLEDSQSLVFFFYLQWVSYIIGHYNMCSEL